MQTPALVALTACLAAAVGAGTHAVLTPDNSHASGPQDADGLAPDELVRLRQDLAQLDARVQELADRPTAMAGALRESAPTAAG